MKNTILALLLTACSISPDNGSIKLPTIKPNNGVVQFTAVPTLAPDADTCDYTEMDDTTNDDDGDPTAIELTGLSFPGTATLCGVINNGHYNATYDTVDVDNYEIYTGSGDLGFIFTVSGETILASGGEIAIQIADLNGDPVTGGFVSEDIAAFKTFAPVPAGDYQLNVSAFGTGSDSPTAFPYVITIVGDL